MLTGTGNESIVHVLAESAAAASIRAQHRLGRVRRGRGLLVLRGAGGMGRDALAALRAAGEEPVCFCDDRLAGEVVDGLQVLSTREAAARYSADAAFVVTVMNPGVRTADVIDELTGAGAEVVCTWVDVAWSHPEGLLPRYPVGLPHMALFDRHRVHGARRLFADEPSLGEFDAQIRWRVSGDFTVLPAPQPQNNQYFEPGLISLTRDDVVYDCGAFDGDTLRSIAEHAPAGVGTVVSLEPDPHNLVQLGAVAARSGNVTVLPYAVGESRQSARWDASGTAAAALSADGTYDVQIVPIDEISAAHPAPTFIKMDIEGAEPAALRGAARTIAEQRPILAVCVYHAPEHLWEIPLQVADMTPGYRYHLRRYEQDGFDVVLYAIPGERPTNPAPNMENAAL